MTSNLKAILCETQEDIDKCIKIRIEVFVDEQGYELDDELDEKDPLSDHILLLRGDDPQGTIRYYHPMGKLGRLGVLQSARGLGAGKLLVEALEDHVKTRKGKAGIAESGKSEVQIVANAQAYAEGFYRKCGYSREGDEFLEDGQPHVRMVKTVILDPPQPWDVATPGSSPCQVDPPTILLK